jgi:hypothetical protein
MPCGYYLVTVRPSRPPPILATILLVYKKSVMVEKSQFVMPDGGKCISNKTEVCCERMNVNRHTVLAADGELKLFHPC